MTSQNTSTPRPYTIYMLAGLGFDRRAFGRLDIAEQEGVYHLDWIDPRSYYEPIEEYAQRMLAQQIAPEHLEGEILFIGHSFGGVMSQELARLIPQPKGVILISSIKSHREKPFWLRLFYWLPVYWLLAKWLVRLTVPIWGPWYGYKTGESRRLLLAMAMRFSNRYHRWATRCISWWRPKPPLSNLPLLSLHGSRDRMFPCSNISPPLRVLKGGNHFMIFHEAEEFNPMLDQAISSICNENEGDKEIKAQGNAST